MKWNLHRHRLQESLRFWDPQGFEVMLIPSKKISGECQSQSIISNCWDIIIYTIYSNFSGFRSFQRFLDFRLFV
jgi:hypothetical protein